MSSLTSLQPRSQFSNSVSAYAYVPPFPGDPRVYVFLENRPILLKIRENAFFLFLGAYGIVLVAWYAYNGVLFQFSLGLWALALLPPTLVLGKATQFARELTPFLVLLLSYEALQGVAGSLAITPVIHATPVSLPFP